MGEETEIAWTDHTFNPWWGCARVSPGCEHCYAEAWAKRTGLSVWGVASERRFFGDKHWNEPLKWDAAAKKAGVRRRVFCASMSDVFEDRPDLAEPRARLFALIKNTPDLDWLILTKRPEHADRLWRAATELLHYALKHGAHLDFPPYKDPWLSNIWLGTTTEDQKRAEERLPHLLKVPAAVRFISAEPLLGPLDLGAYVGEQGYESNGPAGWVDTVRGLDWVIVGGESGGGARPGDVGWIRDVVRDCRLSGTRAFVKQLGAHVRWDGCSRPGEHWPTGTKTVDDGHGGWRVHLKHPKAGDPDEWPEDLRIREFPEVAR